MNYERMNKICSAPDITLHPHPERWVLSFLCPGKESKAQRSYRTGLGSPASKWCSKDLHAGLCDAEPHILLLHLLSEAHPPQVPWKSPSVSGLQLGASPGYSFWKVHESGGAQAPPPANIWRLSSAFIQIKQELACFKM